MRWEQKLQFATLSDIGLRRQNNEDSAAIHVCSEPEEFEHRGHLFVVADGMGGHAVGELASKLAAETVPHSYYKMPEADPRRLLREAIVAANAVIHDRGTQNRDFLRMGTTCTALSLSPNGAVIGHVGDSRCYRIRRDRVDQLTCDHSLQWELERQNRRLAQQYDLSEHRNIITRSLGPEPKVDVDVEGPFLVMPGDVFLLCSDGLSGEVRDEEIGALASELSPQQACRCLVHLANARGGGDNCTVTVVRVGELPANVPPPELPETTPPPSVPPLGWSWVIVCWAAAMLLILGAGVVINGSTAIGSLIASFGVGGFLAFLLASFKRRAMIEQAAPRDDLSRTNYWRPYRTALVRPMAEMYEDLGQLEAELRRAAQEEGWNVDWTQHAAALKAALEARQEKRFGRGVRDFARAIDCLMSRLNTTRRNPDKTPLSPSR